MPDLLDRLKQALADRYRVDREIGLGSCVHLCILMCLWACGGEPTAQVSDEGWLWVATATVGAEPYEDGYLVSLDSGAPWAIGVADSMLLGPIDTGAHRVELRDIDVNCALASDSSRAVEVRPADTVRTHFSLACSRRIDQSNLVTSGTSAGCGSPPRGNLAQSFRPATSPLTRVVLRLRAGGSFPANGYSTTIRIRNSTPSGIVRAAAEASVPYSSSGLHDVAFDFAQAVAVVPNATYVIEWESPPSDAILTWMMTASDTYRRGNMFGCWGGASTGDDLAFATYR